MSILSKPYFYDEKAAFEKLEEIIWPNGPVCPKCGHDQKIYSLKGVFSKPSKKSPEGVERHGLKKCSKCRKQFTVRVGTVFESSHIPLHKWFQAVYLMCSSKKGISAHQLHRTLEITYKSAWFMAHRIREAMASGDIGPMGGEGQSIQVDETYFGKKDVVTKRTKNGKPSLSSKMAVVTLISGGKSRTFKVDKANTATIREILAKNADPRSELHTDESRIYTKIGKDFKEHKTVQHYAGEYVRDGAHTNGAENYFSVFKRGMKGVYQHCSEKHLHRYLAEYDFRYNHRTALGVDDSSRTINALAGISGKRLTYGGSKEQEK